ncbi:MAG: hypothetical protein WCX97_04995 [Candidatus Magasanikbacteria bacterium]
MFKKYKKILVAVFALVIAFSAIFPLSASALTAKSGDNIVTTTDTNSNFFGAGNMVIVDGTINGDVFIAGNNIVVKGTVSGDVFVAGNNIDISGTIKGSLRAIGSNINVRGRVERNILSAGNNLSINEGAFVGGHITYAGVTLVLQAPVGGQVDAASPSIVFNNSIGGDVNLVMGNQKSQLSLLDKAALAGSLTYKSSSEAQITTGAKILGTVNYKPWEKPQTTDKARARAAFVGIAVAVGVIGFLGLFLMGLILIYLAPKLMDKIYTSAKEQTWSNLGIGMVGLIATPIIAVLLICTIVGIPLGFLVMFGLVAAMYFSKVIVGIVLGRWILERFHWRWHKVLSLLLGLVVFVLVCLIPFVGWLAAFFGVILVFGALLRVDSQILKEWR